MTAVSDTLTVALAALDAGLCPVPPARGLKHPKSQRGNRDGWKKYQTRHPSEAELRAMCADKRNDGIGLVTGNISGNLELFEFDDRSSVYSAYLAKAVATGLGDLVDRIRDGYLERSPSGGIHWLYRCDEISGNTKLAGRPKRPEEMKDPEHKVQVLIETRGVGQYVVIAPTLGRAGEHPDASRYELIRGGFDTIAVITPEERRALWDLARTFDTAPKPKQEAKREPRKPRERSDSDDELPGEEFNRRGPGWRDLLEGAGWTFKRRRGDVEYWLRPGKEKHEEPSATLGHSEGADGPLLYVFSTNTVLDENQSYSKFGFYTYTHHGGDFAAAARDLSARGYGKARPRVTLRSVRGRARVVMS